MWYEEKVDFSNEVFNPTFSMCCQEGIVSLPPFKRTPNYLDNLIDYKKGLNLQDLEKTLEYTIQCFNSVQLEVKLTIL